MFCFRCWTQQVSTNRHNRGLHNSVDYVIILVLVLNNILHFFLIYIIFIVNLIEGMLLFVQKHLLNTFYKLRLFCPELFIYLFILGKVNCRGQCKVNLFVWQKKADKHRIPQECGKNAAYIVIGILTRKAAEADCLNGL